MYLVAKIGLYGFISVLLVIGIVSLVLGIFGYVTGKKYSIALIIIGSVILGLLVLLGLLVSGFKFLRTNDVQYEKDLIRDPDPNELNIFNKMLLTLKHSHVDGKNVYEVTNCWQKLVTYY